MYRVYYARTGKSFYQRCLIYSPSLFYGAD